MLLILPSLSASVRVDVLAEPIFSWNHAFASCSTLMFWILKGISQVIFFSIRLEYSLGNYFFGLL
jgi:hypothetical protein